MKLFLFVSFLLAYLSTNAQQTGHDSLFYKQFVADLLVKQCLAYSKQKLAIVSQRLSDVSHSYPGTGTWKDSVHYYYHNSYPNALTPDLLTYYEIIFDPYVKAMPESEYYPVRQSKIFADSAINYNNGNRTGKNVYSYENGKMTAASYWSEISSGSGTSYSFEYDSVGRRTAMHFYVTPLPGPASRVSIYSSYDTTGLVKDDQVELPGNTKTTIYRNTAGKIAEVLEIDNLVANDTTTHYFLSYDTIGRLRTVLLYEKAANGTWVGSIKDSFAYQGLFPVVQYYSHGAFNKTDGQLIVSAAQINFINVRGLRDSGWSFHLSGQQLKKYARTFYTYNSFDNPVYVKYDYDSLQGIDRATSYYYEEFNEDVSVADVDLIIYPNPSKDMINIKLRGEGYMDGTFSIVDMQGRVVLTRQAGARYLAISLDRLMPGSYIVRYSGTTGTTSVRFVKW